MPDVEVSPDGRSSTYHYSQQKTMQLDSQLDAALARMNGDARAAAQLFLRWAEFDSEIRALIPDVITDYVERRVAKRAKERAKK